VKSTIGTGSIFSFDVKVAPADEKQIAAPRPTRRVKGLSAGQPLYRILIAEDRDSNRQLLMKMLAPLGFDVHGVKNGAECVAEWESWEPHLIWMDMRMPVMDGYEATRRIKASVKGQATVIIALTASAFETDRQLILTEGCDDFVRKPFVEEEILEKLEQHLGVKFDYASDQAPSPQQQARALSADAVAALPVQWREEFRKATVDADYTALLQMIDQIRPAHPETAQALAALVQEYRYEAIMEALGPAPVTPR
jgi:CheY-like chemotaxis protein